MEYRTSLLAATIDWQIERNRVIENDGLLMCATLFFAAIVALSPSLRTRWTGICGGLICGLGVVLTQSRAFWVTSLLGVILMLTLLSGQPRRRLITLMTVGGVLLFAAAFLLFKSELLLVMVGLLKRFLSLGTAVQDDISLINRFYESVAVSKAIAANPIVGHGAGVTYLFFDATRLASEFDSFAHNGYLGLWYKWGLWGLGILLWFWFHTVSIGFRALRVTYMPFIRRVSLVGAVVAVTVYSIPATTSNPFYLNDTLFLFAFLWAVIRGNADALLESANEVMDPDRS